MIPFSILVPAIVVTLAKEVYDAMKDDPPPSRSSSGPSHADLRRKQDEYRQAQHTRLVREACDSAVSEVRAILATHADVVCGNARGTVTLAELRRVAATAPGAKGTAALEPLALGLNHTPAHRTEARRIDRLAQDHAALTALIGSL